MTHVIAVIRKFVTCSSPSFHCTINALHAPTESCSSRYSMDMTCRYTRVDDRIRALDCEGCAIYSPEVTCLNEDR